MKQKYITATEARKQFFDLIEQTNKSEQPIYITLKGIPEAVLVSREAYDGLIATLETYEDPELMEAIKEAEKNFAKGEYSDWEDVKKELGLDNENTFIVADKGKKTYVPNSHREKRTKGSKKA